MKIAVIANTSWYVYNFRLNLLRRLKADGHEAVALAPVDPYADKLERAGIMHRCVPFSGAGINPLRELQTVWTLRKALREEGIQAALTYTPKGNIYAGLACIGLRVRVIANISGLGRAFIRRNWLTVLTRWMYRLALRRAECVFFQNADDRRMFLAQELVHESRALRLPGSGVDLRHFQPRPADQTGQREESKEVRFLMIARLLRTKGVQEYVDAARRARASNSATRFALLGPLDASADGVPEATVRAWVAEGVIAYLGSTDDVRPYLRDCDCVVLPSVREGVPRTLLEAAAMALPLIATDTAGCRDCVDPGENGLLCQVGDSADLARCMLEFAALPLERRVAMGRASRAKAEREFDENIVIERYVEALRHSPQADPGR